MPRLEFTIPSELHGKTVRQAAMQGLRCSSGLYKRAKFHGTMLLDGIPVHADARVATGQVLRLEIPEKDNTLPVPSARTLSMIFEDEHLLIADKPAPLPTACSSRQDGETLENLVYAYLGCPDPFVYRPVNRLDKGTSGLMVVAKTAYAQHLLQQILHTPDFLREYLAVTDGCLPEDSGVIDLPIGKAEGSTVRREVRTDGKPARTFYTVLNRGEKSLIRLKLETGRTHQIRVHLSAMGCPVTGDFLYGTETLRLPGRFALHSAFLTIRHPVSGEMLHFESPLPPELAGLLR